MNKNKKKKKNNKGRLRGLFGKNNKNQNDEDEQFMNDENDDDEKAKMEDSNKSERVLMGDDDRNILKEFNKTMTRDSVQVISIQKIKDNAAKTIVYNALLTAKQQELKDKNVENIERVLLN